MSDVTPDRLERLNFDDMLARVERQQAETGKFVAEQSKVIAEQRKLYAEQNKLTAEREKMLSEREKMLIETLKIGRDRWLAPLLVMATLIGAFGGTLVGVIGLLKR